MTVQNPSGPVASAGGNYGQWLAQLVLQKKSMDGQQQAVSDLLASLPSPGPHLGQHIDVRL